MNYFNCLLAGDWGTGKTTAASTAPEPILFLDIDNKLHRMVNLKEKLEEGRIIQWAVAEPLSKVGLRRLASSPFTPGKAFTQQRPEGYLKLADMIEKLVDNGCRVKVGGKQVKVKTVVLDSYTTMDEHIRRLLTSVNSLSSMTLPLYGTLLANFEEINNTLLRLPANIILICHEKADKDELTGKITIKPLISGQMSQKVGKDFEEVYAMTKTIKGGKAVYKMNTVGDSMRSCRTSRNLTSMVEPDFSKIYGENKGSGGSNG